MVVMVAMLEIRIFGCGVDTFGFCLPEAVFGVMPGITTVTVIWVVKWSGAKNKKHSVNTGFLSLPQVPQVCTLWTMTQ